MKLCLLKLDLLLSLADRIGAEGIAVDSIPVHLVRDGGEHNKPVGLRPTRAAKL